MEVDDIQTPQPACKYSRVNSNGRLDSSKIGTHHHPSSDDEPDILRPGPTTTTALTTTVAASNGVEVVGPSSSNRLRQWQHSSRIIRVSRASGGKDRHSKVWTAKGPRDRRVRLSVTTAIQFYDLQDRLGFDQPSKAVEWLIKAAADAINELPSLNNPGFPPEPNDAPAPAPADAADLDGVDPGFTGNSNDNNNTQMGSVSRSGCSSNNSETSKGSGLSLSRSEIRVKARERARERTAKEKDRDPEPTTGPAPPTPSPAPTRVNAGSVGQHQQNHNNVGSMAQTSSFTQLLTAGISSNPPSARGPNQWLSSPSSTPMDYFGGPTGLISPISPFSLGMSDNHHHHHHHHQDHHQHQHQHHFPYVGEHHLIQVPGAGGSEYNLNFSISTASSTGQGAQQQQHLGPGAGLMGNNNSNRGTLQSNSPSLLPYLQRLDGSTSVPFFLGGAAIDNTHHHHQQFQLPGLQLCYGEGGNRQSDHKGKGKN